MQGEKSERVHAELGRLASELALPLGIREASERFATILVLEKVVDRIPPPVIAASSVYAVARESRTPVTIKEVARVSGSSPKEIGRCYRQIVDKLNLQPQVVDAALYATRLAERAHVSEKAVNLSAVIARKAVEKGVEGRNPMTLAAAAVYMASLMTGEGLTQSEAAEAAGVVEQSVRECAKAIRLLIGIS